MPLTYSSWNSYDPHNPRRSKNIDQAVWEKFHDTISELCVQGKKQRDILDDLHAGPHAIRLGFQPS
jgi:hypothetical protein